MKPSTTTAPEMDSQSHAIAANIRAHRETRHWTQAHLAMAAGVTERTVQRAEEAGRVSSETLLALAGALDVSVESLTRDGATETVLARAKELAAKYETVALARIDSTAAIERMMAVEAFVFQVMGNDERVRDAAAEFQDGVTDLEVVWTETAALDRRRFAKELLEQTRTIEEMGSIVKVGFYTHSLTANGRSVGLPCAVVVIAEAVDDRPFALVERVMRWG